jgi:lysozyme family protein
MPITLQEALVFTLKWEGGYTNHPLDPGGATNYGIIQSRYDQYRKSKGLAVQSVKFISKAEYEEIYDVYYWDPVRAQFLSGPLGLALFDTAVNLGVGGCISRLQASLKVPITGKWTQAISDVIHSADQTDVAINICKLRIAKRYARVKQKPSQKVFLKGWLNRDNDLLKKVKSLAGVTSLAADEFSNEFDDEEVQNEFDEKLLEELEHYDEEHGS